MAKLLIVLCIFLATPFCFAQQDVTLTTIMPTPPDVLMGENAAIGETYKDLNVANNYLVVEEKVGIGTMNPEGCFEVIGYNDNPGDQDTRVGIGGGYEDFWYESLDNNEFWFTNIWNGNDKTFYTNFRGVKSDGNVPKIMTFKFREWFGAYEGRVGIMEIDPDKTFYVNGKAGCTSGSWSGSDIRLKQNIQPIQNALEKITALQGISFEWRREEFPKMNFSEGRQLGLTAQDVEKVFPELVDVTGDTDHYKHMNYNGLLAPIIEAIKELKTGDEELKVEVEELKARL